MYYPPPQTEKDHFVLTLTITEWISGKLSWPLMALSSSVTSSSDWLCTLTRAKRPSTQRTVSLVAPCKILWYTTNMILSEGISAYSWQTVGNTFNLLTSVIAAVLYGNIGIKVLYANVGREFLRFPALESRVGKWIWVAFVPGYWILAWIVAAAVPQVSFLGSFVGAAMILQFSYTFPPLLHLGFRCLADSMPADGGFDPATGPTHNPITFGRIWRGFKVRIFLNTFNLLYFLGALTTAILGIYASIVGMIGFYQDTQVTAFSCNSPTG